MYSFPISFAFGMICMIAYYIVSPSWKALMAEANPDKETDKEKADNVLYRIRESACADFLCGAGKAER
jgi:hypothetical protein